MGLYDNPTRMWFGTEQKMGWIETPQTGADVSSIGMSAEDTLLSGGGYVRNSWDSHKVFQFSWGDSATPSMVSLLQAYRNGSYGRGFLYFHDPMHYMTNLLPKRLADPSMAVNFEAEPLIPDVWPTAVPVASTDNNYPVNAASYPVPANYSSQTNSTEHFIPIPTGMALVLGAVYSGTASIYVRTPAGISDLPPMAPDAATVVNTVVRDQPWARIGIRKVGVAGTLVVTGMSARLASSVPANDGQTMTYTNIATAPSFEIGGPAVEIDRNLFVDPLPVSTTGFFGTRANLAISNGGITMTVTEAVPSPIASRINVSAFTHRPPVTPGIQYELSADSASPQSISGAISILFFDSSGTFIPGQIVTSSSFENTPSFHRESISAVAPVGAVSAGFYLGNGGSLAVGDTMTFRNIKFGAPGGRFFFPGDSGDPDMTASFVEAVNNSQSILTGLSAQTPMTGFAWSSDNSDFCIRSSQWSRSGTYSARMISRTATSNSYRYIFINALPLGTYTIVLPIRLATAQSSPTVLSRTIEYRDNGAVVVRSEQTPNVAGESEMRLTFTKTNPTGTHLIFINQRVPAGDADMWMGDFTLVSGEYAGPAFTGYTPGAVWNGTPNASTSTLTVVNPISGEVGAGPWFSGEGHSGCRFVGNPTVVNYNGVGGGQIGLSAMFKEVGAWA